MHKTVPKWETVLTLILSKILVISFLFLHFNPFPLFSIVCEGMEMNLFIRCLPCYMYLWSFQDLHREIIHYVQLATRINIKKRERRDKMAVVFRKRSKDAQHLRLSFPIQVLWLDISRTVKWSMESYLWGWTYEDINLILGGLLCQKSLS